MRHNIILSFMDQCPPGKRGRPLSPGSVEASGGSGVCEKETRAGRTVYYRTAAGQEEHKRKQGEKAESLFKRRAAGEKIRGRRSKVFLAARGIVESRLGRPAKNLDEFLDALKLGNAKTPTQEKEVESEIKSAYESIVATRPYSRIVDLPDLYEKIREALPDLSVEDYKKELLRLGDRGVIDLLHPGDSTVIKRPELSIPTGDWHQLYYVLWR